MTRTLALLWLVACGGGATTDLVVDLKTDLQPGFEIDEYEIDVQAGDDSRLFRGPIRSDSDWIAGDRLTTIDDLPRGVLPLQVTLFHEGAPVVSRPVRVDLDARRFGVTVMITRDCRGIACPAPMGDPTATACLAGSCADPRCVEETLELCPAAECSTHDDCVSESGCAVPTCSLGRCYFGAMDCDVGERCDPDIGCVRIDGSTMVESVRVDAPTQDVPAGDRVELLLSFEPAESQVRGERVRLRTSVGLLETPAMAPATEITVEPALDGSLEPVTLLVPLGLVENASIDLTATVPITGDSSFRALTPVLRPQTVDGATHDVAGRLVIENPLINDPSAALSGRAGGAGLAVPFSDSSFDADVYVGVNNPPEIHAVVDGQISLFTTSPGDPDENVSPIAFARPTGPYGDFLYTCSASLGGGDGVFQIDSAGNWVNYIDSNNCNGIAFDRGNQLGDPGWSDVMYLNWNSMEMERVSPTLDRNLLTSSLPFRASGFRLYIPTTTFFAGSLILLSPADDAADSDGVLQNTTRVDPWDAPTPSGMYADPTDMAFPTGEPFGELALLLVRGRGELLAFRSDRTVFTVVRGLDDPVSMVVANDGSLWIAQRSGTMRRIAAP